MGVEDAEAEVRMMLRQAALENSPATRRAAVRRLQAMWHPDKYASEDKTRATRVFQRVQREREKLGL